MLKLESGRLRKTKSINSVEKHMRLWGWTTRSHYGSEAKKYIKILYKNQQELFKEDNFEEPTRVEDATCLIYY